MTGSRATGSRATGPRAGAAWRWVLAGALALVVSAAPGSAQISPGPLAAVHAELEGSRHCLDCHRSGKGVDAKLCLACHRALSDRIAAGKGLHARAEYQTCQKCHPDHNGRDFALVFWPAAAPAAAPASAPAPGQDGRASFDHRLAGFTLEGAHAKLDCAKCHRPERVPAALRAKEAGVAVARTFLGLGTGCVDCHRDPHGGQPTPARCTDCHSQVAWKPAAGFDHGRTRYPLSGAHRDVACLKCHQQAGSARGEAGTEAGTEAGGEKVLLLSQFRDTPQPACARCHQDAHRGKLGAACANCHDTGSWKTANRAKLDHDKTAYPLRGRHGQVACERCHVAGKGVGGQSWRMADFSRCESCHRDAHAGQLVTSLGGKGCVGCHGVEGFVPALYGPDEHARSTFALRGGHLAVPCVVCHREVPASTLPKAFVRAASGLGKAVRQFRFAGTACRDCHQDPHQGQLDRYATVAAGPTSGPAAGAVGCAGCHNEESWRDVRFDHERSRYPLRGKHVQVACTGCHPRVAPAVAVAVPLPVAAAKPGAPKPGAPPPAVIARTLTVSLQLTGRPTDCAGCHKDVHGGQLAIAGTTACERCHTVDGFKPASGFDHQRDATWKLDGAHIRVACAACHLATTTADGAALVRYKPVEKTCEGCHRGDPAKLSTQAGARGGST